MAILEFGPGLNSELDVCVAVEARDGFTRRWPGLAIQGSSRSIVRRVAKRRWRVLLGEFVQHLIVVPGVGVPERVVAELVQSPPAIQGRIETDILPNHFELERFLLGNPAGDGL